MIVSTQMLQDSLTERVKLDLQNIAVKLRKLDHREYKVQLYEKLKY